MKIKNTLASFATAASALPLSALAHSSDAGSHHHFWDSLSHAVAHPFTGADHLAAMLAVGAWSALAFATTGTAWRAPAAFVALLVAGALAGFAGLQVPGVEPMIAASVLVLGLLVALQRKMAWGAAAGLAGVFAFFHGAAHGYELGGATPAAAVAALAGMALGSAVLHLAGMVLGHTVMQRHQWIAKASGLATAALGAFLLTRLA